MQFLAGVERELAERAIGLTIQLAPSVDDEIAVYRRWYGEHRVDGVFLFDPRHDDPRFVDALGELGLPTVFGEPDTPLRPCGTRRLWSSRRRCVSVRRAPSDRLHGRRPRVHPHREAGRGLSRRQAHGSVDTEVVWTDYTPKTGRRDTPAPDSARAPTAILFDSDLLAVTGLGVAQQMGLTVPGDLSIIGWDDSLISQVVHPPLTAISAISSATAS